MKTSRTLKHLLLLILMLSSLLLVGWQNPPTTVTLTTRDNLIITLDVPDGWIREVDTSTDQIYLGTNEAAFGLVKANSAEETASTVIDGTGAAVIGVAAEMVPFLVQPDQEVSAATLFRGLMATLEGATIGEPQPVYAAGFSSAARGSLTIGDNVGMLYVLYNDDGALLSIVLGNDIAEFEAILATATLSAADTPAPDTQLASYVTDEELSIALAIPSAWTFEAIPLGNVLWAGDNAAAISSAQEIDLSEGNMPFVDGRVLGIISVSSDALPFVVGSNLPPTAAAILEYLAEGNPDLEFGPVTDLPILGYGDGAYFNVMIGDNRSTYLVLINEAGALIIASLGIEEATLIDLVAGIRFTAPEITDTETSPTQTSPTQTSPR